MKKGFTLIEMIVSVALLGLLAIIIIVNLNKNLKDASEKEYVEFVEKIKSATNVYMAANKDAEILAKDENGYNIISLERLDETGLISLDELIDPETKLPLSDESTDQSKKYVKIYDDEKIDDEKSDATLIKYPADGDLDKYIRSINYEMNNFGIGTCTNESPAIGETIKVCSPSDDNATFKGWYLDRELVSAGPAKGSDYKAMEDTIFYAKWYKNKSSEIKEMTITSATSNYLDKVVNVNVSVYDVYGGDIKICISNSSNVSSCINWKEVTLSKGETRYYTEKIDLSDYNSSNITGSGKSVTLYVFVKNTAYTESENEGRTDTSLIASKSVTYQIYKYCSNTTVTTYGDFDSCNKSCGGGSRQRTNKVRDTYYSSVTCPDVTEKQTCNTQSCCSSTYASYTDWSTCSASCNTGKQTRTVKYISNYDGRTCSTSTQTQNCNTQDCCSSTTASYGSWGSCSASCGGGIQNRTVTYTSNYDGRTCSTSSEAQSCNTQTCCYYSHCISTGQYYAGQLTYFPCNSCSGCETNNPNFASDLCSSYGICCDGGSGGGSSSTSCPSGYSVGYYSGFNCYPVCYKATALIKYYMSDGYDYGCYSGWVDTGTQCVHYLCP